MKNVLFIHSSSELYGSDRSLLYIIKNLDKSKYNVYVILPYHGPLVNEMRGLDNVHIEIFKVAVLRRKNLSFIGAISYFRDFIFSVLYLKKCIRKYEIDIVDTNTAVVFPGAIAAKYCKVKNIWHIREIISNNVENKIISSIMNRYADLIVANSKETGKALRINSNKIRVIYNAVEEKPKTNVIPHEQLTVGMAGRINRWKGQKLFVDAAKIVHKKKPEVLFKIAGDVYEGEEHLKSELLEYIDRQNLTNTVLLLGQIDNMSEFYRGIDIFILPSIQPEPFGLVVIEAMEYGVPVIATNHGGPTEIIENNIDGFLVDYQKPDQMAECILKLIMNEKKRREIGINGHKKKRQKFSVNTMVTHIENIFEEIST